MSRETWARIRYLTQVGKFGRARQEIEQALVEYPDHRDLLAILGDSYLEEGNIRAATMVADRLVAVHPDFCRGYYVRAKLAIYDNDWRRAEACIRQALAISPATAGYLARLAQIKMGLRDDEAAVVIADQALAIAPQNILALNVRSKALLRLGELEVGLDTAHTALSVSPDNAFTHANYGFTLLDRGRYGEAEVHFRTALGIDAELEEARLGLKEVGKAKYWWYRKYRSALVAINQQQQWGAVVGGLGAVGAMLAGGIVNTQPTGRTVISLLFLLITYVGMLLYFSMLVPMADLLLLLKPSTRYLAAAKEYRYAGLCTALALLSVLGCCSYIVSGSFLGVVVLAYGVSLALPVRYVFGPYGEDRLVRAFAVLQFFLAVAGTWATAVSFMPRLFYVLYTVTFIALLVRVGSDKPKPGSA